MCVKSAPSNVSRASIDLRAARQTGDRRRDQDGDEHGRDRDDRCQEQHGQGSEWPVRRVASGGRGSGHGGAQDTPRSTVGTMNADAPPLPAPRRVVAARALAAGGRRRDAHAGGGGQGRGGDRPAAAGLPERPAGRRRTVGRDRRAPDRHGRHARSGRRGVRATRGRPLGAGRRVGRTGAGSCERCRTAADVRVLPGRGLAGESDGTAPSDRPLPSGRSAAGPARHDRRAGSRPATRTPTSTGSTDRSRRRRRVTSTSPRSQPRRSRICWTRSTAERSRRRAVPSSSTPRSRPRSPRRTKGPSTSASRTSDRSTACCTASRHRRWCISCWSWRSPRSRSS